LAAEVAAVAPSRSGFLKRHPLWRGFLRLLLIWAVNSGALLLLAHVVPGVSMPPGSDVPTGTAPVLAFLNALSNIPTGTALAFAFLNAVIWPLLIRFALPLGVVTVGLGPLLLNGVFVYVASRTQGDIYIANVFSGILVAFGITVINTMVTNILGLSDVDYYYRRGMRRRAKRVRPKEAETDVPGVIFLEIDGLAHDVLRRAIRDGNAATIGRWKRAGHRLMSWECDCTVDFYISDPTDPIIRAYAATFPGLFKPLRQMPGQLPAHIRVPAHQFAVQSAVYGIYHISDQDPSVLYNREDVWDLAVDQPYYVELRLPGEAQAEYLQIVPYSPFKKQNLVSWLAVRNDPGHYGELTAFVLPKDKVVLGPLQVMSRIQQTPDFSSTRTLLNQQGSSLIEGTLLVVPIGDSFLYFEPIYLKSTITTQALPELKFVILTDATGLSPVTFQPTLQQALAQLIGEAPASTGPPGTRSQPGIANPQVARLLDDALAEYRAALDALKTDDLIAYQQHLQKMVADLQQADQLEHGLATGASPSP
jgi:uncharacterized membrane protein YvlD (DUF360 family)